MSYQLKRTHYLLASDNSKNSFFNYRADTWFLKILSKITLKKNIENTTQVL